MKRSLCWVAGGGCGGRWTRARREGSRVLMARRRMSAGEMSGSARKWSVMRQVRLWGAAVRCAKGGRLQEAVTGDGGVAWLKRVGLRGGDGGGGAADAAPPAGRGLVLSIVPPPKGTASVSGRRPREREEGWVRGVLGVPREVGWVDSGSKEIRTQAVDAAGHAVEAPATSTGPAGAAVALRGPSQVEWAESRGVARRAKWRMGAGGGEMFAEGSGGAEGGGGGGRVATCNARGKIGSGFESFIGGSRVMDTNAPSKSGLPSATDHIHVGPRVHVGVQGHAGCLRCNV